MADVSESLSAAVLVVTFSWSAAAKVLGARRWAEALSVYSLPKTSERLVFLAVPIAELAVVGAVLAGESRPAGALAMALLCAFSAALIRARRSEGDRLPCGCFGSDQVRDYRVLLLRNLLLLIPALVLVVAGGSPTRSLPGVIGSWPALLAVSGLVLLVWTASEVARALKRGRHH